MSAGFVMFRLGGRTFATSLEPVREIARLAGLEPLPGTRPPLAGVIVHRGDPLPVMDVRPVVTAEAEAGDVLVLADEAGTVGVAVDAVLAVLHDDELGAAELPVGTLPDYVVGVRRRGAEPVLLVDLRRLIEANGSSRPAAVEVQT